jgi:hypothetical protein
MTYFDFNDANDQNSFDLIPKGTLVRVRLSIRPGGFDDAAQGWDGGYATRNANTGSVYLNCEFVVLEGEYARRKLWSLIGLYSPKGPGWGNMGRTFIKGMLNSARGLHPADMSPPTQNARRIDGFADLDGLEFLARVDWEKDQNGQDKAVIKQAIQPDHRDYAALMGGAHAPSFLSNVPSTTPSAHSTTPTASPATSRAPVAGRPSWAQ